MRFCKNCGKQLTDNQTFCTHCGTLQAIEEISPVPAPTRVSSNRVKQPLSMKAKTGIVSGALVVAALVGTHFYLSSETKPIHTVDEFKKAVQAKDAQKLSGIINSGQDELAITDDEAASLIDYLVKENDFTQISKELEKQAYSVDGYAPLKPITDAYNNKLVKLKKSSNKKWFVYDQYVLEFFPIELTASSNLADTEIWLDGKKTKTIKEAETPEMVGYIFPGSHKVKAIYKGKYSELTSTETLDISDAAENELSVSYELEGASVTVYSNDEDAVLYLNGKSTNLRIDKINSFGPIATDGSIKLHAQRKVNGKTEKTEEFAVTDDSEVELLFEEQAIEDTAPVEADLAEYEKDIGEDDIARFMDGHFQTQVEAINARDFSLAEITIDPAGPAYTEARKYIGNLDKRGITEDYEGMNLISYEKTAGGYHVTTEESYTIYYGDGTTKYKNFRSKFYVSLHPDGLKVYKLLETKEIPSYD
ncbi:zinc ribbon domain-containing protein [Peribacillus glennii]|uniref:Zinc-ribbon domain-containing protein n=1 Tax=Peribacillus glennii TaxID=2303991 RepID=A0A372L8D1_9BACI|nr:zinc-ribbon domain-containing protein [Peribacillus glennii]RFU61115.1 zinc-ribbon domain-containing protein [Peribacillus glennii]